METDVNEIADGIYRFSTFVPDIGPTGFTFNQFLVDADEPLLFHTGQRGMFPLVSAAIAAVMPVERLRWITFGHLEADECGAMNQFLAAAPDAQVAHGALGCMVSINDLADRPPRPLGPDEVLDLGGKRIRNLDTPHVPHGWDAHVLYEETTGTLFCGDLIQPGRRQGPALTGGDLRRAPRARRRTCSARRASRRRRRATIRQLAELAAGTGSRSCTARRSRATARRRCMALADDYDRRLAAAGE